MIIQELARNVLNTEFDAFDEETVEQAKLRVIDIMGCAIGGAKAPGCQELLELIRGWGGRGEATVLVHGGKVPAHLAAWINSIMARSFDFGVLAPYIDGKPVWAHIAETTVPVAVTMAEARGAGGRDLLAALIVGDDLTARLTAASAYSPAVSWDSPGIVNKFGATAIAGRLLDLSEEQLIHAFGIVLNMLAGSFQTIQDTSHSFKLAQGLAARDGVVSAELAAKGWTAGKDAFFGKYGYFQIYCESSHPEYLTKDLGKKFYGDITFKPYPSCRFTHSAIDCALELASKYSIAAEDVEEIVINVAPMHYNSPLNQPFEIKEFMHGSAIFSLRYTTASALLRKSVRLEHYTKEMILAPDVLALVGKAEVKGELPPDQIEAAEVSVRMKDGRIFTARKEKPKGNPLTEPLSREEILQKFRDNAAFSRSLSRENTEKALDLLLHLEEAEDITNLVRWVTCG